jgi:hypothetical protein
MKRHELALKGVPAAGAVDRALGNLTLVKEESREVWIWVWLQTLAQDIKFALRLFKRDRGFAVTAVLVLAVGIGMTNAVFTMANGLLYSGLSDADERIMVLGTQTEQQFFGGVSRLDLEDWRAGSRSFKRHRGVLPPADERGRRHRCSGGCRRHLHLGQCIPAPGNRATARPRLRTRRRTQLRYGVRDGRRD